MPNWETEHNNFAGMRIPGTYAGPNEGGFQSFDTPDAGIEAIGHQLDRYQSGATTGRPVNTLRGIINTWAPPSTPQNPHENDTPLLLRRAINVTGFGPDQPLDVSDPVTRTKLTEALIRNEQGGALPAGVSAESIARAYGALAPQNLNEIIQASSVPQNLDQILKESRSASSASTAAASPAPVPQNLDAVLKKATAPPSTAPAASTAPADPGMKANVGAGIAEGVARTLSFPAEFYSQPFNAALPAINRLLGTNVKPTDYTGMVESGEGLIGADPRKVAAVTPQERVARAAAAGATEMALPGGVVRAIPEAAGAELLAQGATPGGVLTGAAMGATGQTASEFVPPEWKPAANVVGQLAGGAGMAGLTTVGRVLSRGVPDLAAQVGVGLKKPLIDPATGEVLTTTTEGRVRAAGQRLAEAAQNPSSVANNVPPELPPGVTPTLGQASGDLGVLGLERELRNRYRDLFTAHDAANTAAVNQSLRSLSPQDAAGAAGDYVHNLLKVNQAADQAEQASLGEAARAATERLGANPAATNQNALGNEARAQLEALRQPIKAHASQLLDAVDPDGTLALDAKSVGDTANTLLGRGEEPSPFTVNPKVGESLAPAEAPVLHAASQLGGVASFSDLRGLLGEISRAQRQIRADPGLGTESRPFARLSVLRDSVQGAMEQGAADRAAEVAKASPVESSPPVPVDENERQYQNFEAEARAWQDARRNADANATSAGTGIGRNAGTRPGSVPGTPGTQISARGRPGTSAGTAALQAAPSPELTPNFDAEAAERLRVANRAYADYKTRFRTGPVGRALAPGNTPEGYRVGDSTVVASLFGPGAKGGEAVRSLINAAGSPEAAARVLGDYPAYSLRRAAERDGILDPKAYNRWIASHKEALDQLPGLRQQFGTAADASRAMSDAAARRLAERRALEESALRHYMGNPDPQVAIDRLFRSANPGADALDLVRRFRQDPSGMALKGLQHDTVEWLLNRVRSVTEAGTSGERDIARGAFQRIVSTPKSRNALRAILGEEGLQRLDAIGNALDTAARAWSAVRIKGSPGTAADLHALARHNPPNLLTQIATGVGVGEVAEETVNHLVMHATGGLGYLLRTATAVGGVALARARANGIESINQLAALGVLHPELGRLLLSRAAVSPRDPVLRMLSRQLARVTIGATQAQAQQ